MDQHPAYPSRVERSDSSVTFSNDAEGTYNPSSVVASSSSSSFPPDRPTPGERSRSRSPPRTSTHTDPLLITHTSTPTLTHHLPYLLSSLESHFPLRNIHWRSNSRPGLGWGHGGSSAVVVGMGTGMGGGGGGGAGMTAGGTGGPVAGVRTIHNLQVRMLSLGEWLSDVKRSMEGDESEGDRSPTTSTHLSHVQPQSGSRSSNVADGLKTGAGGRSGPVPAMARNVYSGSLMQAPWVNVCLVECEDPDAYKSSVRPHIHIWKSSLPVTTSSHAHNIVVLVSRTGVVAPTQTQGTTPAVVHTRDGGGADGGGSSGAVGLGLGSARVAGNVGHSGVDKGGSATHNGAAAQNPTSSSVFKNFRNSVTTAASNLSTSSHGPAHGLPPIDTSGTYPFSSSVSAGGFAGVGNGTGVAPVEPSKEAIAMLARIKADFESAEQTSSSSAHPNSSGLTADVEFERSGNIHCVLLPLPATFFALSNQSRTPLPPGTPTSTPPSYARELAPLMAALKEAVLGTLEIVLKEREASVKRGEANLRVAGASGGVKEGAWGRWFVFKESLACTFMDLGLMEDALLIYDELEASLMQAIKDGFPPIGDLGINAFLTSEVILSAKNDDSIRIRMREGEATILDYRSYIFRKQAEVLLRASRVEGPNKVEDLRRRGVLWVTAMGRWFRDNEPANSPNFAVESWIYDAALEIDYICGPPPDYAQNSTKVNGKANLWQLAIQQLDRAGVTAGYLPHRYPFLLTRELLPVEQRSSVIFAVPPSPTAPMSVRGGSSDHSTLPDTTLLKAVQSLDAFYDLYARDVERASQAESSNVVNQRVVALSEKRAALAFHRSDYASALKLYSELAAHYVTDTTTSATPGGPSQALRKNAFSFAIESAFHSGDITDSNVLTQGLHYLEALVSCPSGPHPREILIANMVVEGWKAHSAVNNAEQIDVLEHPALRTGAISRNATLIGSEDGCRAEFTIECSLPISIQLDDLRLCFSGSDLEQLWFATGKVTLQPGVNRFTVTCLMSVAGLFKLDFCRAVLGKLALVYQIDRPGETVAASRLLRLPADPAALSGQLRTPPHLALDGPTHLQFELKTGRNDVTQANVTLEAVDGAVSFVWHAAQCEDAKTSRVTDSSIILGGLERGQTYHIHIPYAWTSRVDSLAVHIIVDYVTKTRKDLHRAFMSTQKLDLSLQLAVNVQDFFRPSHLLSKFTVTSVNGRGLSVGSGGLSVEDPSAPYVVTGPTTSRRTRQLMAGSTMPFVFKVAKTAQGSTSAGPSVLRFLLQYRTLSEELEALILAALRGCDDGSPASNATGSLVASNISRLSPGQMVLAAETRWTFAHPDDIARQLCEGDAASLLEVTEALRQIATSSQSMLADVPWRTLSIPVEIPSMEIITCARAIFPADQSVTPGVPISVKIEISTSFAWSTEPGGRNGGYEMTYDITADRTQWLVGGRKRGTYIAKLGRPFEFSLSMIPLRSGRLAYPSIQTQPLPVLVPPTSLAPGGSALEQYTIPSFENFQKDAASHVEVRPVLRAKETVFVYSGGGGEVYGEGIRA